MAEGIARSLGHEAASAGTHPEKQVNPNAIIVLKSMDIDTTDLHPKSIDIIDWESYDKIISMGCGVSCPMIRIDDDWGLDDPHGQDLSVFEECAKTIEMNIRALSDNR